MHRIFTTNAILGWLLAVPMMLILNGYTVGSAEFKYHELLLVLISTIGFYRLLQLNKKTFVICAALLTIIFLWSITKNHYFQVARDSLQIYYIFSLLFFVTLTPRQLKIILLSISILLTIVLPGALIYGLDSGESTYYSQNYFTAILYSLRIPAIGLAAFIATYMIQKQHLHFKRVIPSKEFMLVTVCGLAINLALLTSVRTRGFFLSIALVVLLYFVFGTSRNSANLVKSILAFCVFAVLALISLEIAGVKLTSTAFDRLIDLLADFDSSSDASTSLRLLFWEIGIDTWLTGSPIQAVMGIGFGSYIELDPWGLKKWEPYPVSMIHNQFLSIAINGGIPVLVLFFLVLKTSFNSVRKKSTGMQYLLMVGAAYSLYAFFTPVLPSSFYTVHLFFFLSLFRLFPNNEKY